ncbi:MAG: imidazole glycerol phosphate synthase subunit HisH [Paludibacteraceae bacterium]|nr:imidazole glycerol phosphate synthase subunit HisH [Paludibacteraceae bacterium]MBP6284620.1 imidazole glycerol phosphate synthase subunit HisH [Paludibacteraceae bacterium]
MQKVTIIKYNAGNIYSVVHALRRLGIEPVVTADEDIIRASDKVIFPGVGEATTTMRFLKERNLDTLIASLKQPVLGICLGMQLMCKRSEEGNVDCLGIFDVPVKKFVSNQQTQKIPHMGWNQLYDVKTSLFSDDLNQAFVYFVHSFYVPLCADTIASNDYIQPFSAALHKDNFYATQFHPEKSGGIGEQILRNFLAL